MGQLFTLAPVGWRCSRSDYGATKAITPFYPASLTPLLEFSHPLRSFPVILSLSVFNSRQVEGMKGEAA